MSKQQDVIAELLRSLREKDSDNEEEKSYEEEHLAQLKAACDSFLSKETFEVGQIVKWKKYLKNRRLPHKNQPAIVVSILDEPIVSTDDESGSPYFLEKLDIVIGVMSNDGAFLTFHYDSSRFESY
ncbi:MAG: hypothetical protein ACR9NN_18765 [Nostochopsis sp.]